MLIDMRVYECTKTFHSGELDVYIPSGAILYRFENVTKILLGGVSDPTWSIYQRVDGDKWEIDQGRGAIFTRNQVVIDSFFVFLYECTENLVGELNDPSCGGFSGGYGVTKYIVGYTDAPYSTVEEAIIAAQMEGSDSPYVHVRDGIWPVTDCIVIPSGVHLKGSGDGTIFVGTQANPVFCMTGAGAEISNLSIFGQNIATTGVNMDSTCKCRIANCFLRDTTESSIILENSSRYNQIEDCVFQNFNPYAIDEQSGDFNQFSSNVIM